MLPEHGPSTRHVFFPDEPETCTSRAAASATGEQSGDARRARPGEMDPLSLFPEEEALLTTFPEEEAALTTGPHRPLVVNGAMAVRIQERAADTLAQLERAAAAFDAQRHRFESGMAEASLIHELASDLEARIGTLTDPLASGEAAANRLQERAADTSAQLERIIAAFEAEKGRFESGLGEASRIGELVSALEARIGTLTEPGQPLARTEAIAGRLQERAVDTMAQLERIVAAFDAEQKRYDSGTVEVGRIGELISALEARSRKLTEPDQPLARGEAMLGRLQQHAVDTKVQLEAMTAAFKAQKNTIASGLAEAARLAK